MGPATSPRLARLLREIGLDREARSEAVALLNSMNKASEAKPTPEQPEVRAAALEASSLDSSAAAVYEELHRVRPAGLRYATFRLDDGVSFVHLVSYEEEKSLKSVWPTVPSAFRASTASMMLEEGGNVGSSCIRAP